MPADADIERLYREVVLEHYRAPRHRAPLAAPDGRGRAVNPTCGDAIEVEVELRGGCICEISARALGCSIAVAAASVLADLARGRQEADARRLGEQLREIVEGRATGTGMEPNLAAFAPVARLASRRRCALLAGEALEAALASAHI